MTALTFQPEHYPIVKEWWESHGWPVLYLQQLSTNGIIIFNGEMPICAGWLYSTDAHFKLVEWVVANPKSEKSERDKALDLLFVYLLAKTGPEDVVVSFSLNPSLTRRFEKHGFKKGDSQIDILTRNNLEVY